MHGLLVPEEALPKTVQAGVIAPEIPDRSDVQKGAHNAYEIQPMHECRQLGIELERNERPDHVRREEIEEWDQPHDERDGQKAGRKNDPVHDPVLGGGDFSPSLSTLTSACLPRNLCVKLFAHSDTVFCGQAQPHQTVPIVE